MGKGGFFELQIDTIQQFKNEITSMCEHGVFYRICKQENAPHFHPFDFKVNSFKEAQKIIVILSKYTYLRNWSIFHTIGNYYLACADLDCVKIYDSIKGVN